MKLRFVLWGLALTSAVSASVGWAQDWSSLPQFSFQSQQTMPDDAAYKQGLRDLDAHQWEQAIASFARSAARNKGRADAALYWQAYAENRTGREQAALFRIDELRKQFPTSAWLKDARALELEVRAQTGLLVNPGAESDPDLKLMALNVMVQSRPGTAVPAVQQVLTGDNSEQLKEQALFVLTQSGTPEANKLLDEIASGASHPALQVKAIQLMGMMGGEDSRKKLDALYAASQATAVKEAILQSMFLGGDTSRLNEIVRTEKIPELRASAIQLMALKGGSETDQMLMSIFGNDKDPRVREAVLDVFSVRRNGKLLITLAKREKDPAVKQEIVERMGMIRSPEVTDYMRELLK